MAYKDVVLTCIRCPRGCQIGVGLEDADIVSVDGHSCKRGEFYARSEVSNPVRTVTTTVPVVVGAEERMVSVKTSKDVPKDKVMDVMRSVCGRPCSRLYRRRDCPKHCEYRRRPHRNQIHLMLGQKGRGSLSQLVESLHILGQTTPSLLSQNAAHPQREDERR